MTTQHVLILGSGAAGAAATRTLASRDDVRVTLVTRTGETPYTRMLIKGIAFGPTPPEMIKLPLPQIEVIADTVLEVDTSAKQVRLTSGAQVSYDALIVATGSMPRSLPADVFGDDAGQGRVTALHSVEDALGIRKLLTGLGRPARVAIYGGGIIAAETASSLQADGHMVTLVSRSSVPGIGAFGAPVAERLAADHAAKVQTRFGRTLQHVDETESGVAITLDDGDPIVADFLLVALGTTPAAPSPWTNGIDVDDHLRAAADHVYAAGGVATHHDEALGAWRIDHWEDAAAQGAHAAQAALHDLGISDDPSTYLPRSPYMAMVYGQMISGVGYTAGTNTYLEAGEEFIVRHETDGMVVGVTGIDAVGTVYQWGQQLHGVQA
ncbi:MULTISPECIES: FAD-dependent oxidoreductase [Micrococcales]|uniref:3-phenylpropionate/trans-cinnamate dioxygenase ferredoxin reductase subunit n=3 Tax=Actinomycetes TaxID=1760 RepID=A0A1W2BNY8_9MICO|nr:MULTISPECIES: NAD(P)/FAD-dependent oxidoreductase [Micrococcales]HRY10555.1 NAD(P)/FAD-dependent oxidoreductase [Candidatus Nanopelagicales bacterium]MCL6422271.1 NAD(P)/FAD-dependent oxidoreductase [Brachybacterium equifaecis]MCW4600206.1 NAD(P)/FAD-dependent oxidoreductase [Janibacter hoylei]QOK24220.1 FAD-dependent oxidoreductase [Janibacter indicus]RYI20570.1 FAD-dependent oxidoreductase [Dermacoccus sp. 147Ba]